MTIDNEQLTIMVSLRDDFNKLVYLISRPCHCEPVRTLVWQSPAFLDRFLNFSRQEMVATE